MDGFLSEGGRGGRSFAVNLTPASLSSHIPGNIPMLSKPNAFDSKSKKTHDKRVVDGVVEDKIATTSQPGRYLGAWTLPGPDGTSRPQVRQQN